MQSRGPFVSICLLLLLTSTLYGQVPAAATQTQQVTTQEKEQSASSTEVSKAENESTTEPDPQTRNADEPNNTFRTGICRRFEIPEFLLEFRYRFIENSAGVTTNNQLQTRTSFKARCNNTKYSFTVGIASGNGLTSGWNPTGVGTGSFTPNLHVKEMYGSFRPSSLFAFDIGGFALESSRGESTEITWYDKDLTIPGVRVTAKPHVLLDEMSVTFGRLDRFATPSVIKRLPDLVQPNFLHVSGSKKIAGYSFSMAYTSEAGVKTLRQAAKVDTKPLPFADYIRFETYQRLNVRPDAGFAVTATRKLSQLLKLDFGYAQIDRAFGAFNGDKFLSGRRVYVEGAYEVGPGVTLKVFATGAFGNDYNVPNRTRFDIGLSVDPLKVLKGGLFGRGAGN